ncbi:MAG: beta-lactamase family protein [Alphaproteobacteria bacterium]|nr:beta-lactamase family protein [Alphaproteobacteria bacterium]
MIEGSYDPRFRHVREVFAAGFAQAGPEREIGASLCVHIDGRPVLDLWGGHKDPERTAPWTQDTIVNMMSVGKAMLALVVHQLAEDGAVDPDAPVARLWPEFSANGKESILVRHVLDHTAGLPYIDGANPGDAYDWTRATALLAAQRPTWPAGRVHCYHSLTLGFLAGEIARRAGGKRFAELFAERVAGPLQADYGFCLSATNQDRCATFVLPQGQPAAPGSLAARWADGLDVPEDRNSARHRRAELYAINGHGCARGVARIYAALAMGGTLDGTRIISEAALRRATTESWYGPEQLTGKMFRMALGFRLCDPAGTVGLNDGSFGHGGRGGATAFADPAARLSFCYAPSRGHPGGSGDSPRGRELRDAVYACL